MQNSQKMLMCKMKGKKDNKYKLSLLGIISDTSISVKEEKLEKARINLEILSREFRLMLHEGFMGGHSIFAVIYFQYTSLKRKYDELITEAQRIKYNEKLNDETLIGLS